MASPLEDEFRKVARAARFAQDLQQQRQAEAQVAHTKAGYLDDFNRYAGAVDVSGSWRIHYNNNTPENARFKRLVDGTRYTLDELITSAVHAAKSNTDALDFRPTDPDRPAQLSTFRLALSTLWGSDYRGMTIAGAVERDGINVFHAGPGS